MQQVQVLRKADKFIIEVPAEARTDDDFFLEIKFQFLAEKWKDQTRFFSLTRQIAKSDSYQAIIAMGKPVLPLILADLQREPNHWFFALQTISEENPVKESHLGNIKLMTNDWLKWGKKRKLI